MQQPAFDILIVGTGLVGNAMACALSSRWRVGLLTAEQPVCHDERSIGLSYGSQQFLAQLGLWETLEKMAVPIKYIHISHQGHFGAARFNAKETGVPALGYIVPMRDLSRVFSLRANQCAHIHQIVGNVKSLQTLGDRIVVHISTGIQEKNIDAKLLLASDGAHSTLRQLQDIGTVINSYHQTAIVANIALTRSHHETAYERFTPSGPLAMLPLKDNHSALVWAMDERRAEILLQLSSSAFLAQLQHVFGYRLGRLVNASQRQSFPLHLVQAKEQIRDRFILLGNALHNLHPVSAQGFNLSLRDIHALVSQLNACVEGDSDPGSESLLKDYQKRRRIDQQRTIRLTDGVVKLFSNQLTPLAVARSAGLVAMDILPFIKHVVLKHTLGVGVES